jgi:hypothetical protein
LPAPCSAISLPTNTYPIWDSVGDEIVNKGKLSQLQLEGVRYACNKHLEVLPSKQRAGFFIGDGAGVGKGRQIAGEHLNIAETRAGYSPLSWWPVFSLHPLLGHVPMRCGTASISTVSTAISVQSFCCVSKLYHLGPACFHATTPLESTPLQFSITRAGIILDNYCRGRVKHIWLSTSTDLHADAQRDLSDLGMHIKVINNCQDMDAATRVGGLSKDYQEGVLFLTYSTLVSAGKGKQSRFAQVLDWVGGAAFDGCLIFDECHKCAFFLSQLRSPLFLFSGPHAC